MHFQDVFIYTIFITYVNQAIEILFVRQKRTQNVIKTLQNQIIISENCIFQYISSLSFVERIFTILVNLDKSDTLIYNN